MKITAVQACALVPPPPDREGTPAYREPWTHTFRQATPMDKFDPPASHREPGGLIWVKVTAEDGTWGLGSTDTGHVAAVLIAECLAPLIVGQEVGAINRCN
ncbi:MAG: hypothetical protein WDA75_22545, partial [Candidatus Latescibacterota bacterium]